MNDTANQQLETTTPQARITQGFEGPRAIITSSFGIDETLTPEDIATAAALLA